MGGELGIEVNHVEFGTKSDLCELYGVLGLTMMDLSLYDKEGKWLHICGKNDWGYLLTDALQPLLIYEAEVRTQIDKKLDLYDGRPEIIGLGKNEYRAIDIVHRLRGVGDPIKIYKGIPVFQLQALNRIELFGKDEESLLPF